MKKVIALLFIFTYALSVTFCNNINVDKKDFLIGNWQLQQEFENEIETQLDESVSQNTYQLKTDKDLTTTSNFDILFFY